MAARGSTRSGTALTTLLLALALVLASIAPATAAEPPVVDNPVDSVTADPLPTAQVDGVVWDQAVVGRTVYAGGQFTSARPAGAAPGRSTTPRYNLMSYDVVTGRMTSWAPIVNGRIRVVTASPDGSRLYIGGSFTEVDGQRRSRIAAFDTADGSLVPAFAPRASSDVFAIAATDSVVYYGGWFGSVDGVPRSRLAASSATSGALLGWAPSADHTVYGLGVTGARDRVVVAGGFTRLNGVAGASMGSLDATTGASYPFAIAQHLRNTGNSAAMYSLNVEGDQAYSTAFSYGTGNFEGALIADARTGAVVNLMDCHGDTYDAVPFRGLLHVVSHNHHCDNIGGFPAEVPDRAFRATAITLDARGTVARNNQIKSGYGDWEGYPVGSLVSWFPDLTPGTYTGSGQAAWTVEAHPDYIVQGGEFTAINGVPQQGLVRFGTRAAVAQPRSGPLPSAAELVPTLIGRTSTSVAGSFRAAYDRDGARLTYRVLRDDLGATRPVATLTADSNPWTRPRLSFVDAGVVPGWSYTYRVAVTDADGNGLQGDPTTITVPDSRIQTGYSGLVMADEPAHYWRLGQAGGATTSPSQVSTSPLALGSGAAGGATGALAGDADRATQLARSSTGRAASVEPEAGPGQYSVEAWFRTTSMSGAMLVGFGDRPSGASGAHDRHLYLDDAGRLVLGINATTPTTVRSTASYNDGRWHHVVGTVTPTALELYADGVRIAQRQTTIRPESFDGHWRLGGDTLGPGWPGPVTTPDGGVTLDEVAVYATPLPPARVAAHHEAGRQAPAADRPPEAAFEVVATGRTVTVDSAPSRDAEGALTLTAWEFGDGSTSTGPTATHAYAAAGTYPIVLTVVDAAGQVARATRSVTVEDPANGLLARDDFARTGTGWGSAPVGGAWTTSGGAPRTADGRGLLTVAPGRAAFATLDAVSAWDADVRTDVTLDRVPSGGHLAHRILLRESGPTSYRLVTRFEPGGDLRLYLMDEADSIERSLASLVVPGFHAQPGERINVRARVSGDGPARLAGKVWRGDVEPTGWMVTATDTTPLAGGVVGVGVSASSSATTPTATFATDRFEAVALGANAPPVAGLTVTTDALTVSVDGTGSRDPDGSIVAWAWEFGDGATSTGPTATRTYRSPGKYTVRLTVTDDRGGTASASRAVTVTEPSTVFVDDGFDRDLAAGWGDAPQGGPWTLTGPASFSVSDGAGRVSIPVTNATRTATLAGVSARDVSLTTTIALDRPVAGDSYYHQLVVRASGSDVYSLTTRVQPNGNIYLVLARKVAGVETVLRGTTLGSVGLAAHEQLRIRLVVSGEGVTSLRGTAWRFGTPEPAAQVTATDSTPALQRAGAVGMKSYTGPAMSSLPLGIAVDQVRATNP